MAKMIDGSCLWKLEAVATRSNGDVIIKTCLTPTPGRFSLSAQGSGIVFDEPLVASMTVAMHR